MKNIIRKLLVIIIFLVLASSIIFLPYRIGKKIFVEFGTNLTTLETFGVWILGFGVVLVIFTIILVAIISLVALYKFVDAVISW